MGAFDYIPKPFTPAELRALVSRAIKPAEVEVIQEAEAVEATIPAGYYYLLGHTWLKLEEGEQGMIGVMPDFLKILASLPILNYRKLAILYPKVRFVPK